MLTKSWKSKSVHLFTIILTDLGIFSTCTRSNSFRSQQTRGMAGKPRSSKPHTLLQQGQVYHDWSSTLQGELAPSRCPHPGILYSPGLINNKINKTIK